MALCVLFCSLVLLRSLKFHGHLGGTGWRSPNQHRHQCGVQYFWPFGQYFWALFPGKPSQSLSYLGCPRLLTATGSNGWNLLACFSEHCSSRGMQGCWMGPYLLVWIGRVCSALIALSGFRLQFELCEHLPILPAAATPGWWRKPPLWTEFQSPGTVTTLLFFCLKLE